MGTVIGDRRGRLSIRALAALGLGVLALALAAPAPAGAHGTWYALAEAPFIQGGHFWAKGRSYSSNYHRKQCVTVWLQEWDDGQWVSAHGWRDCRYDYDGYVASSDTAGCGWLGTTITEKFRTKTKAEYYDQQGELVHQDTTYSGARTLSC